MSDASSVRTERGAGSGGTASAVRLRSAGTTLLVCCLLALAGCGGPVLPEAADEPTVAATPAPVPTTTPDRYPPGVSPGLVDPQVVATAMRTELRGTAYTWTLDERGTFGDGSTGTEYVGSRVHADVAGPARYVLDRRLLAAEPGNDTLLSMTYVNGSRALTYDGDNVTAGPVGSAQLAYPSRVAANIAKYLRAQRVRTTPFRNGTVLVRGTGSARPGFSNYSVDALIGPEGTVLRLDAEYTDDGRSVTVRFRLDRATAFDPPAWAEGSSVDVTR